MGPRRKMKFKRKQKRKQTHTNNKLKGSNEKRKIKKDNEVDGEVKRKKIENFEVSSESSEEENNHFQKLLETFRSDTLNKESNAIDSEYSSEESEVEELDKECTNEYENSESKVDHKVNEKNIIEEDEIDDETQKEDENFHEESHDPFSKHLLYDLSNTFLDVLQSASVPVETHVLEWSVLGKLQVQIPKYAEDQQKEKKYILEKSKPFALPGNVPIKIDFHKQNLEILYIKQQIKDNVIKANKFINSDLSTKTFLTPLQAELFSVINNYQDMFFPRRTLENGEEVRFVYCLHTVNHILKTRTKILHHNAKLNKKDDVPEEFRDQGLVRPKVLILVPFRDSAYKIITCIINILLKEDKGNVINKIRFIEEFTGHELTLPKRNPKPEDYEQTFTGNTGDEFKIGITITKKSLKLFADFYSSDIIIASPLGLRTIIGAEGEPNRDYDFLASIELFILDQTEIFLMQNWDHVIHIFNHMHLQQKESHGTDFSRVRTWALNGWSKYYRQTLIFSSVVLPEINSLFNKKCFNYAGKVKIVNPIKFGSICQVYVQLPHIFQKFYAENVTQMIEERFNFFINKVFPQQSDTLMRQTLIYITNYFDYVRLRNHFKREDIGFVQICEYSKENKVARARDLFFHGDAHFLLYTERFHFFNRIRIKGIRHLVFYSPPVLPHFYYEMCNLMQEANMNKKIGSMSNMTVTVLYCKYDINQLAAIVGTERAVKMVESDRNIHMLVTDAKDNSQLK